MDVPEPNDQTVEAFATGAELTGDADDANAEAWPAGNERNPSGTIEGSWSSRWNGGVDPTVAGDAADKWKTGEAELRIDDERVYVLFDWYRGARRGLIDARRTGSRLIGKYINLSDPKITRPWVGLVVSDQRIDGRWTNGRLDFRR